MTHPIHLIRQIVQKDAHTFAITWNCGKSSQYRLSDLQKQCPCAKCCDENTGKRLIDEKSIDPLVEAKRIYNVGRYALKIEFSKGCSTGIYGFDMLYNFN